jgi:flagellar hook-associated protein 1
VMVEQALVVDDGSFRPLTVAGEPPVVKQGGTMVRVGVQGGPLGEMMQLLEHGIPGIRQRLDTLARGLVVQTNALHNAGFLESGDPAGNFFDPDGVTAATIRVVAQPHQVAASDAPGQPANNRIAAALAAMTGRPENNEIALGIWTPAEADALGGRSASEFYRVMVIDLAGQIRIAEDSATIHGTLAHQSDMRRQSVSGVSTDEELIRVMQHQQAYTAAARLVTVVDEMIQTVLDMKR